MKKSQKCLFVIIIITVIILIDSSKHNIDAPGNPAAVPLIIVTNEETDTTSKGPVQHPSRIDKKGKTPLPSITPINMDDISLKGKRSRRKKKLTCFYFPLIS